jgi:molybdate transport system regulatory protein
VASSQRRLASGKPVEARVKVWLEKDGRYVFGLGLSKILKAVDAAGSIKAAAERLGKSYRHVWGRIKEAERVLGEPLVETRVGGRGTGRSSLTALAGRLMADYDALRWRMFEVVRQEFSCRFQAPSDSKSSRI